MAKSQIDRIFERDPLSFLKSQTVSPGDYSSLSAAHFTTDFPLYDGKVHTQVGGSAIDSTLSVTGAKQKIAYTKLEEIRAPSGVLEANAYNLVFKTAQEVGTSAGDYIACYFLPWASNH